MRMIRLMTPIHYGDVGGLPSQYFMDNNRLGTGGSFRNQSALMVEIVVCLKLAGETFYGEDHAVVDSALFNLIRERCDKPFVFGLGANCSAQVPIAKALVIGAVAQDNFALADQTLPEWLAIDRAGQA